MNPIIILVNIGSINGHEIAVRLNHINACIINRSTIFIAHHAIHYVTGLHLSDIVGKDVIDEFLSLMTTDDNLAHVTDIKDANMITDSIVFVDNTCVLDRHIKATERLHQSSESHMFVIETGSFVHIVLSFKFLIGCHYKAMAYTTDIIING